MQIGEATRVTEALMHRGNMITFVCDSNWLFTEQRHTFPDEVNVYRCQSDAMRTLADMNAYAPLFFLPVDLHSVAQTCINAQMV